MHYGIGKYAMIADNGKQFTLDVFYDDYPESPRAWSNVATIVTWHRHYIIGDENVTEEGAYDILESLYAKHIGEPEYDMSIAEMIEALQQCDTILLKLINAYEHGGITISLGNGYPFNDRWDAYVIGFIYVEKDVALKELIMEGNDWRNRALRCIKAEIDILDDYLRGDVYGAQLLDADGASVQGPTFGFYGDSLENNGILDEFGYCLKFA